MPTANEIRQQFIDFFVKKHGHTLVPSSPVVPFDDPTLLFTNAGMNQFKDVFLGTGTRPYKRAANTQKCIRAGGKHNDLDDVGKDTYHHTFFEMLGNWSFGDYFKKEAIAWAWELLTGVWKLDKSRLHATVFEGDPEAGLAKDDEAAEFWRTMTDIDPSHIHLGNKKDNFWEMGDTGPCGPCSEIHYDRTPDKSGGKLVNAGSAEVIEIWNLVFIQFNRGADKKLTPLPAKHVDTGMGFERITAVLQGKDSNYDTDVFSPLMDAIGGLVGKRYGGRLEDLNDIAFRVIADHLRMVTFAITDGALPDNKGRGSVVRGVLRRAVLKSYLWFSQRDPLLFKLVPALVEHMGGVFPELKSNPGRVQEIIRDEESDYLRTLAYGVPIVEREFIPVSQAIPSPVVQSPSPVQLGVQVATFSGERAFVLATTHGVPLELTIQIAEKHGKTVGIETFSRLMREHEEKSRGKTIAAPVTLNVTGGLPATDDSPKWSSPIAEGTVLGWMTGNSFHGAGSLPETQVGLILDRTCFYAEQGGQVGDQGVITTKTGCFEVQHTKKVGDAVLHVGRLVEGNIEAGQLATLEVSGDRPHTMRNHTATHLLNWALRKVLGGDIDQKGSLVDPDKTRFDFTHDKPLSSEEITEVERLVNERLYCDLPVAAQIMPLAEAKKIPGVRAVFGEKYPDPVRVIMIGVDGPEDATDKNSVEFCGGTHLTHTGQAGFFKIISQEPVSKGVRRVTAVTGKEAVAYVQRQAALLEELSGSFNCKPEELPARVASLQDEVKKLQQQLKKGAATDLQGAADKLLAGAIDVNGAKIILGEMPSGPAEIMLQQVDRLRQKAASSVVVLGWADDGKVGLLATVTDDLVKKGLHAGKLIGQIAAVVGGKGGGKPTMAQAGGKDPAKLGEALELAKKLLSEQLAK